MNITKFLFSAAFVAAVMANAAHAETTYTDWYYVGDGSSWNGAYYSRTPDGTGENVSWGATDRIVLTANRFVTITDSTIDFFAQVGGGVRIGGTNVTVEVTLTSDKDFGTYIGSFERNAQENSVLVKKGGGTLTFTKAEPGDYKIGTQDIYAYMINFDVQCGVVQLAPSFGSGGLRHNHGAVTVAEGCEVRSGIGDGAVTVFRTLSGAGTVRGTASNSELRITETRATPTTFSGYLTGFSSVCPVGHTYFTGLTNDFPSLQPFNYNGEPTQGVIGFATFAGANGTVSSLGTTATYGVDLRNGPSCLRYLGSTGETITRLFAFMGVNSSAAAPVTLDAGEHGGLVVESMFNNTVKVQQRMAFTGDKSAAPSVIKGWFNRIQSDAGNNASFHILKKGGATWRKMENAADMLSGGVDVEEGAFEYESVRDIGFKSALGTGTDLYEAKAGSPDTLAKREAAHVLGGMGDEAIFTYLGTYPRTITTRPIGLVGNARIKAPNTAAFRWQGISGVSSGEKTLTVETVAGQTNTLTGVTDGSGKVSVAHEGAGELVLTGSNGFTGDLTAMSGTLTVRNVNGKPYSWYKLTVRETVANSSLPEYQTNPDWKTYGHMAIDEWALYDANGARQNSWGSSVLDLTTESPELLAPGHIACVNDDLMSYYYAKGGTSFSRSCVGNLVNNGHSSGNVFQGAMKDTGPDLNDPNSWVTTVLRLKPNTATVTGADLRLVQTINGGKYFGATPTAFSMYGSSDGMVWEEIASTNDMVNLPTDYYLWAAAQKYETRAASDPVIPLSRTAMKSDYANCAAVRSVSAAPGATVRCEGAAITVKGLRLDASGAGTIDGFALADEGEIIVENAADPSKELKISATFANMSDLAKLSGWTVKVNGVDKKRTVAVTPTGIKISPLGLAIIMR